MKSTIHLLMLLAAALCITVPAQGAQPVTTSMQVPLAGEVFVPLSDGSSERVALTGRFHVVTHIPPNPIIPGNPIRIQVNLDQVSGVGDVTGFRYVATGANRINLPFASQIDVSLTFDLRAVGIPPNPVIPGNPVMPLDIFFSLSFNLDTGALTGARAEVSTEF